MTTLELLFCEYPLPALGTQYEAIYNMEEDFAFEVAPARTFVF